MAVNGQVDFHELQNDIKCAQELSKNMGALKFDQLHKKTKENLRRDTYLYLKKYIEYYLLLDHQVHNTDELKLTLCDFEFFLNDILHEWKNFFFIEKRLNVVSKVRSIKLRLYMVTTSDTCTSHMIQLENDANRLRKKLTKNKDDLRFPDLFQNLQELIKLISYGRVNTTKQTALEAASGVLTIGGSAVSGLLGVFALVGRSAPIAARGLSISASVASDAVSTGKVVSTAANIAVEVVNVGTAIIGNASSQITSRVIPSSHAQQPAYQRFQRLNTMVGNLIAKERHFNSKTWVLKIFNEMTKDEHE